MTTIQQNFSAVRNIATCLIECGGGHYQKGQEYDIYVDNIFTPVPLTEEEKEDYKNKSYTPKNNYTRAGRKCIYSYSPTGKPGYIIFESEDELQAHFNLKVVKKPLPQTN